MMTIDVVGINYPSQSSITILRILYHFFKSLTKKKKKKAHNTKVEEQESPKLYFVIFSNKNFCE